MISQSLINGNVTAMPWQTLVICLISDIIFSSRDRHSLKEVVNVPIVKVWRLLGVRGYPLLLPWPLPGKMIDQDFIKAVQCSL